MRLVWPTARTFFTRRCVWWQLTRTEFLYVYRVIIYVVIAQIPTAQILSRFVKHLAFFSYQTDICFVIWPVHFTGPLAHSFFFFISNRFGGRTCNCFKEATTLPTTSGKETRERTAWSMPAKAARDLPKHLNHSSRPLHFLVVFVAWFYFDSAVISQLKTWPVLVCYALLLVRSLAIQPLVLSYSVLWIHSSLIQNLQVYKISANLILICRFWNKFNFLLSLIIQFFLFHLVLFFIYLH